ncbi:MAG TPA: exodeoxyribonuclease VII small subunit [Myxococcota bacterium]|jgi:exodeoxyribonuclease VII small subunit|nr:exodeoxyribonuclease VII small subunit [Myxococcota bacterium]
MGEDADAHPSRGAASALSFEEALAGLEAIVERLETGELALEQALVAFEEGVRLSRRCAEQLEVSERRLEQLVREGGGLATRPLPSGEGEP